MYNIQCTNANNILYQPPQSHRIERKLKQSCHWRINVRIYILFLKNTIICEYSCIYNNQIAIWLKYQYSLYPTHSVCPVHGM